MSERAVGIKRSFACWVCWRSKMSNQTDTADDKATKNHFCQPPASAKKLNAAPGLKTR